MPNGLNNTITFDVNAITLPEGPGSTTAKIMLCFARLLNPEQFKTLGPELESTIGIASSNLAQIDEALSNPFPQAIETLRAHIGTPSKGSKGLDLLNRVSAFENSHMLNFNLHHENAKKNHALLKEKFDAIVAQGKKLSLAQVEGLKAEISSFQTGTVADFLAQKSDLTKQFSPLEAEASTLTGKPVFKAAEEAPALVSAQKLQK